MHAVSVQVLQGGSVTVRYNAFPMGRQVEMADFGERAIDMLGEPRALPWGHLTRYDLDRLAALIIDKGDDVIASKCCGAPLEWKLPAWWACSECGREIHG